MRRHLSAFETALMLLKMLNAYEGESGRELSRFRVSRKTLRFVAGRDQLRDAFADEVGERLRGLGWVFFEF
jgi:hypothetical protein